MVVLHEVNLRLRTLVQEGGVRMHPPRLAPASLGPASLDVLQPTVIVHPGGALGEKRAVVSLVVLRGLARPCRVTTRLRHVAVVCVHLVFRLS